MLPQETTTTQCEENMDFPESSDRAMFQFSRCGLTTPFPSSWKATNRVPIFEVHDRLTTGTEKSDAHYTSTTVATPIEKAG